jgi:anti-sigma regulatory factor (Ser/Thr protein kinase)
MNHHSPETPKAHTSSFWSFALESEEVKVCRAEFAGTRDNLSAIRTKTEACLEQTPLNDMAAAGFVMAVDELASNVIEHGYEKSSLLQEAVKRFDTSAQARRVLLEIGCFSNRIECIVTDFAAIHFAVEQATPQGLSSFFEEQRSRGLGLDIIRFCVDEVSHQWLQPMGNQTRLVKFYEPAIPH